MYSEEELARADQHGRVHLPSNAAPQEIDHAVADRAGVDREVHVPAECAADRIGQRADAELHRGAIGNQSRGGTRYRAFQLTESIGRLQRSARRMHEEVEIVLLEEALAPGPGHLVVDLSDDRATDLHGRH